MPKRKIQVHHAAQPWGIGGPRVKLQRMQKYFPDHPVKYNIIYSVSASVCPNTCARAKKRGVKVVQHINSVNHPAYSPNYNELNKPLKEIYKIADYVVFGSNFAKEGAERYLGNCAVPYSIIYNSVDMSHFTPRKRPDSSFNILAIGWHCIRHRIEPLIQSMPYINKRYPNARLIIAGPLEKGRGIFDCSMEGFKKLAWELGVKNIEFIPQYTQDKAPKIYSIGDILVHLKHMDWTPNTVIEAMACGLPILHTGNGGLPEIVDESAGQSLNIPYDWDHILTPNIEDLSEAIIQLYESRKEKGINARHIAMERFDMETWAHKHREIFESLL